MKRRRLSLVLALSLFIPATALAADAAVTNVVLPAGETVNDNFVRVGQTVEINGDINGDLVALGQSVIVNGTVAGDVLAAAETIRIRGPVGGNIRVAASTVQVDAAVAKNATVFANSIELTDRATVGWSAQLFASTVELGGTVSGNANLYAANATLRGTVKGNVKAVLDDETPLRLAPTAAIGNDLTYHSAVEAVFESGATVGGTVRMVKPAPSSAPFEKFAASLISFWRLVSLFGLLVVGLVLLSILPKTSRRIAERIRSKPWQSLGLGAVGLIVVPIGAIILLFTFIGIPAAIIAFLLYGIALYIAEVYISLFLGTWLLGLIRKGKASPQLWSFILGAVLFAVLTMIPYVGWSLKLIGTLFGFGALLWVKWEKLRKIEEAA